MAQDNDAKAESEVERVRRDIAEQNAGEASEQFQQVAKSIQRASPGEVSSVTFTAFGDPFVLEIRKVAYGHAFVTVSDPDGSALVAEELDTETESVAPALAEFIGEACRRYLVVGRRLSELLRGQS